eukprot:TRINITY_DN5344_c0_g2_i1.p1 TRINITY_DN5344_c0_g2~~TRINITY_DN5344_c0_g2_i1.p1  ORF type:complete len:606 (+),score=160.10 TRINITY_DN5344_c0_g2_i1:72-1889(+)
MAVREFSPIYQWGFSFKTPKFLVPLLNNNVFIFGKEAMQSSESFPFISSKECEDATFTSTPVIIKKKKRVKPTYFSPQNDSLLSIEPSTGPFSESSSSSSSSISSSPESTPNGSLIIETSNVSPTEPTSSQDSSSSTTESSSSSSTSTPLSNSTTNIIPSSSTSTTTTTTVTPCSPAPSSNSKSIAHLSDDEILDLLQTNKLPSYSLESSLAPDFERAVKLRRLLLASSSPLSHSLPFTDYDYSQILGRNCENVVGYIQVPVGVAGPLLLNSRKINLPMATTEGCLVASTSRGCKAITLSNGCRAVVVDDGMTRAPAVKFECLKTANQFKKYIKTNFEGLRSVFESTSRFAKLVQIKTAIAGRTVYIRFKATTGDAMGMNMITKGVDACLDFLKTQFPEMEIISISGNYCSDKKPAAVNWIEGRGKSVVCETTLKKSVVESVLKTTVDAMIETNVSKNLVGSAIAGSIGGFNAHASNVVSAIFLATGQDIAQNVESSSCITLMERSGEDLYVSVTMPSIEVGTVGGGTHLSGQNACLEMVLGEDKEEEKGEKREGGKRAKRLAKAVCGGVLAGEISLMAALSAGHLTQSHMQLNRAKKEALPGAK